MAIAMAALPINRTSALLALWVRIQYRRLCIRSEFKTSNVFTETLAPIRRSRFDEFDS
jgi:hypothetical protein